MCIDPGASYEKTAVERGGGDFSYFYSMPPLPTSKHLRHSSLVSVPDYQRPTLLHGSEGVRMHTNCHFVVSSFLLWDMGNLSRSSISSKKASDAACAPTAVLLTETAHRDGRRWSVGQALIHLCKGILLVGCAW